MELRKAEDTKKKFKYVFMCLLTIYPYSMSFVRDENMPKENNVYLLSMCSICILWYRNRRIASV